MINHLSHFLRRNFKILWVHLPKCEYFLFSLFLCDSELNIFGLWTAGLDKRQHLREVTLGIFHHFLIF